MIEKLFDTDSLLVTVKTQDGGEIAFTVDSFEAHIDELNTGREHGELILNASSGIFEREGDEIISK